MQSKLCSSPTAICTWAALPTASRMEKVVFLDPRSYRCAAGSCVAASDAPPQRVRPPSRQRMCGKGRRRGRSRGLGRPCVRTFARILFCFDVQKKRRQSCFGFYAYKKFARVLFCIYAYNKTMRESCFLFTVINKSWESCLQLQHYARTGRRYNYNTTLALAVGRLKGAGGSVASLRHP